MQDVVSVLERDFLRSLLPDLFGVECPAPTRRLRGLAGVPVGASVGPGIMVVDGGESNRVLVAYCYAVLSVLTNEFIISLLYCSQLLGNSKRDQCLRCVC